MLMWWELCGWTLLGAACGVAGSAVIRRFSNTRPPTRPRGLTGPVAVGTALLFGLLAWRVGARPELLAYSALVAVGVPLAVIDWRERRLPTALLLPAYPVHLLLLGLAALVSDDLTSLGRAVSGMVVLFVGYLAVALCARGGLGAGDVRLAGLLGLVLGWAGWPVLLAGTVLGLVFATVQGAVLILLRGSSPQSAMPLGPALLAGAVTVLLVAGR
ncbi:leader peptidase (prepilin peptidase)/N-methyltransferase [Actinoalloteichus hoggarensis]|uniref:Type IV leader peptidase family protein n=2 Tax=Actinoalloteichus hoggarensis TaxID=1470176 RepID=A0A221W7D0_9PSEU|nr:Type IV leader peptidase family protein [Actinoalloteichus hoggarensis]MBB5922185.1 leader peptidase (prepilin peptidase)/N-methyltransferase [Actinoalloteichus hoggarensis]